MVITRLLLLFLLLFSYSLRGQDVKIIELHTNKSLDQLVLDSENKDNDEEKNEIIEELDSYISLESEPSTKLKDDKGKSYRDLISSCCVNTH